jgi:hypothetical protein
MALGFARRLLEAHWAYGHLSFKKLRKLLGLGKGDDPDCAACTIANSRKKSLAKNKFDRSTRNNHRKHVDLGFTRNSKFVFQLGIDDFTRESYLDVLSSKSDALSSFQSLQRHHDNEYAPYSLSIIRTDSEPLYNTDQWNQYCDTNGIAREWSSRYRHDQHGVAERAMQAVGVPFRCMMIQGCAPEADIPDCLRHANVIRNHSPTKANSGWSPREKAAGRKLPINKRLMRGPLFCLVFAHVYEEERSKHEPRGIPCIYLGYDPINNAYLVKEWASGKKYWTADITFFPRRFPYRADPNRKQQFLHQFDDIAPHTVVEGKHLSVPSASADAASADPAPTDPASAGPVHSHVPVRRSHRSRLLSNHAVRNIPDWDVPPDVSYTTFSNYFVHTFGPDPNSWGEALESRWVNEWIMARLKEQNSFKHHKVMHLVRRSAVQGKVFKPRAVFRIKVNPPTLQHPQGSIEKFKYRLTIAAFTNMLKQGIDYEEKYASTVRWNSLKILFAIACKENYDISLFDISTFFLYGKLSRPVYMEQPDGWQDSSKPKEEWVYKVEKSMYGHPEAPYRAQIELKDTLRKGNFRSTASDDCIYISASSSEYAALGAHVDDLTGIGTDKGLSDIRSALSKKFEITEKRNPDIITGVQVERVREKMWLKLHQSAYAVGLLKKYNMEDCKEVDSPMDPGTARTLMLLPTEESDPQTVKEYQILIGELIWLIKTRADYAFTISLLSRFLKSATPAHLKLAKGRPLRWLKKTFNYGLVFSPGDGEWILSGASDSDLAGDLETARSTMGYYVKVGDKGAILSHCRLERKICTSTGQAETYALLYLVKDVEWARTFFGELRYPMRRATSLYTDNNGVLLQSTKSINHTAAKHYRIAQAYIRQLVHYCIIIIKRIDGTANPSDMYTKALAGRILEKYIIEIMGHQSPPE